VLVDTSVWVDHFRRDNRFLARALERGDVWTHAFVIGELACGNLNRREEILSLLMRLQKKTNVSYLFITHDIATVRAISDEIVVMHQGAILADGTPEEIRRNEAVITNLIGATP